jgi:hypothetical protein
MESYSDSDLYEDMRELRPDVNIEVKYSFVSKCEFLVIYFPFGPNFDLHTFLVKLGTEFQKYYVTNKGRFCLYVRHELPKDVAIRLMSVYMYNEMLEDIDEPSIIELIQEHDIVDDMIEEMERVYKDNIDKLVENEIINVEDSP